MGHSAYRQSQYAEILEAPPEKLVQILYGIAIQSLGSAIQALRDKNVPERVHHINKTIAVLVELNNGLDFERGREIAKTYADIYGYCRRRLVEANTKMDSSILEEVRNHISALNEAWGVVLVNVSAERTAMLASAEVLPSEETLAGRLDFVG